MELRALVIEDNKDDATLSVRALENWGYKVTHKRVQTAKDMKNALKGEPWDIIICDHSMPGFDSREAFSILRKTGQDIPFIILSGTLLEESAIEILRSGAQDYLTKKQVKRLGAVVEREVAEADQRKRRRTAEVNVERQKAMLEAIIESASGPIYSVDKEYRYTSFNKSHAEAMKALYDADAELGKSVFDDIKVEEDRINTKVSLDRVLKGERVSEEALYRGEGLKRRCFDISRNPIVGAGGKVLGVAVYARDITKRKRLELQLIRERDIAQSYLDIVGTMVIAIDTNERITMINKEGIKILGYPEDEIVGKNWFDNFLPPAIRQEVRKVFAKVISGNIDGVNEYDNPVITKEGQERLIRWRGTYIKDGTGRIVTCLSSGDDITERRKAEDEIKHLASFPMLTPMPVIEFNMEGEAIFINPAAQSMMKKWGIKSFSKFLPRNWRQIFLKNAGHRKDILGHELWLVGRIFQENISFIPHFNVLRVYMEDITERKNAESTAQEREEKLEKVFDILPVGLAVLDAERKIVLENRALTKILDISKNDLLRGDYKNREYVRPDGTPMQAEEFASVRAAEGKERISNVETGVKKKDGSIIWTSVSAAPVEFSDWSTVVVTSDITKRKEAEDALRESETRYRRIVDNINDALYIHDLKGNIIDINENACKLLGYTHKELIGRNLSDIDNEESAKQIQEKMKRIKTKGLAVFESLEVKKDGSLVPVEVSARLVSEEGNGIVQAFVRDITDRKKAEKEQAKSYKRIEATLQGTVNAVTAILDKRDPYTSGHEKRVSELVMAIAEEMGLSKEEIEELRISSVLHDIGKICVPSEILSKPGRLSEIEFDLVKMHSRVGYDIVKEAALPRNVSETILQHHERLDGSGYPKGIKRDKMSRDARILAVADVVEAMNSHRPYRSALGIDKALEEITTNKDTLYDPDVADACVRLFKEKKFKFK